jgi:DNA topoisomerase IA
LELVGIPVLGFADGRLWVFQDIGASSRNEDQLRMDKEGQRLFISEGNCKKTETKLPQFLQVLILLMDENRIGTDATIAAHVNVSNIFDRDYVILWNEMGVPLRQPRPPRPGHQKPILTDSEIRLLRKL